MTKEDKDIVQSFATSEHPLQILNKFNHHS